MDDKSNEGGWEWLDGSPVKYVNWDSNEPDDNFGGEDCVSLRRNGKWNDIPCNYKGRFICEKYEGEH